jgi:hypothetical protein
VIVLSGLSILNWFRGPNIIYFWDSAFPFNPQLALQHAFFIWQPQNGIGTVNSRELLSIPYYLSVLALNHIFPLYFSQILLTFGLFVAGGLGTYAFILDSLESKQLAATVGGLFYMFNIFVVTTYTFFLNYFFLFAFAPTALLLIRRALTSTVSGQKPWRYIIGLTIVVFLALPGLASTIIPFALFFVIYISWWIVGHRHYALRIAKTAFFAFAILILSNLWWILPVEGSGQSLVSTGSAVFRSNVEGGSYTNLTFLNSLRLLGTVGLQTKSPAPEFWWSSLYTVGLLGLLSFIIPLVAFSGLLFKRKSAEVYFFTLTLVILTALTSAVSYVPGYVEIVGRVPALLIVAVNPHLSVGLVVVFSMAYLFGNGINNIFGKLARSNPAHSTIVGQNLKLWPLTKRTVLATSFIAVILVSTIGAVAFPIWTGDLLPSNLPARVVVPAYQQNLADYLVVHDGNDARILSLPLGTLSASSWYVGLDVLRWQTGLPILSTFVSLNDPGVALYYRLDTVMQSGGTTEFAKLLAIANIRYVVVHNDAVFPIGFTSGFNLTKIHQFLSNQLNIYFRGSFGKVDLYENAVVPGEVFAAKTAFAQKDNLTRFVLSPDFDPLAEAVVSNAADNTYLSAYSHPSLTFRKISPTQYKIVVSEAGTAFILVMSETFDLGWNAYLSGKVLRDHITVNGYANAWFVPNTGSFEILLSYDPQARVTIGSLISALSLVGIFTVWVSWVVVARHRSKKMEYVTTNVALLFP